MKKLLCGLFLYVLTAASQALDLDGEASVLNVVSIKNNKIAELFYFRELSGTLDLSSGKATVNIALASIDSGIGIRDERMKKHLFNVEENTAALFAAKVDVKALAAMPKGQPQPMPLEGELQIAGQSQAVSFDTLVTKLDDGSIRVLSAAPAFVDVAGLGLEGGINTLRELAGLKAISLAVPVSFSVLFR